MSVPIGLFIGIDLSNDHLDLALSQGGQSWQVASSPEGVDALADLLITHEPRLIALQTTGGDEQAAFRHLSAPVACRQPSSVQEACGRRSPWPHRPPAASTWPSGLLTND